MSELKNPKHEAVAQNLALGMNNVEACRSAGYSGDRGNASHIANRPDVQQRVAELRLSMPVPEVAASSAPEPPGARTNGHALEQLRDGAVTAKQYNAAVQAQKALDAQKRSEVDTAGMRIKPAWLSLCKMGAAVRPPITQHQAAQIFGCRADQPVGDWIREREAEDRNWRDFEARHPAYPSLYPVRWE